MGTGRKTGEAMGTPGTASGGVVPTGAWMQARRGPPPQQGCGDQTPPGQVGTEEHAHGGSLGAMGEGGLRLRRQGNVSTRLMDPAPQTGQGEVHGSWESVPASAGVSGGVSGSAGPGVGVSAPR